MLEVIYYILLFAILLILGFGFNEAISRAGLSKERRGRFLGGYAGLMLLFIVSTGALALTDFYKSFSLPPRLVLLGALPAFAIIIYYYAAPRFKDITAAFPLLFTIYFQSFRIIVELLIHGAYQKGLGPVIVTYEGRNFDIIAGLSAPLVGWMYSRGLLSKKLVLTWNILCLMLLANIVFIFISLMVNPQFWEYETPPVSMDFLTVPYVYIAAVYMPVAVFIHVMSIKKLLQ